MSRSRDSSPESQSPSKRRKNDGPPFYGHPIINADYKAGSSIAAKFFVDSIKAGDMVPNIAH